MTNVGTEFSVNSEKEQEAFELTFTHGHTKVRTVHGAAADEKGQGASIRPLKLKIQIKNHIKMAREMDQFSSVQSLSRV